MTKYSGPARAQSGPATHPADHAVGTQRRHHPKGQPVTYPSDTQCEHGFLYPSVGGQTPCPHQGCGDIPVPDRRADSTRKAS